MVSHDLFSFSVCLYAGKYFLSGPRRNKNYI